jgi:2-polyprenyl-3-methyl-5-hydroxy-6-metoxy-1,4-benzoquinol methylase
MAILEHYPHSQRTFMHHVRRMLSPGGSLYVEVPNLAYWHKRIGLLLGHSPLPAIEDVYHSDVPFTGHHREFTIHDLRQLARLSGLNIRKEKCYNYSVSASLLRQPAQTLANFLWPATRECLAMLCDVGDPEGSPMTDPKDCPDLAST